MLLKEIPCFPYLREVTTSLFSWDLSKRIQEASGLLFLM